GLLRHGPRGPARRAGRAGLPPGLRLQPEAAGGGGAGLRMEPFSLTDRVAVVTGAAGLLGRRHCAALAAAGAHVVATDLDLLSCQEIAADLTREHGVEALGHAADITRPESVRALLAAVLDRFGRLDVLVNNAAVNEKVEESREGDPDLLRFENHPLWLWERS